MSTNRLKVFARLMGAPEGGRSPGGLAKSLALRNLTHNQPSLIIPIPAVITIFDDTTGQTQDHRGPATIGRPSALGFGLAVKIRYLSGETYAI
jgi:hypothetical protein